MLKYAELFDEKSKAEAFDSLAALYYDTNFGSVSKSDIDLLMFSIYLERILKNSDDDYSTYSDYILSKQLGITQSRVAALKERKQLKYPHDYDWREAFSRISSNARYDNGKIKITVPDRNLFIEIKNAVESSGGIIDMQLNRNLLQVPVSDFIDLLMAIGNEKDRKAVLKAVKKEFSGNSDVKFIEGKNIRGQLSENGCEMTVEIVGGILGQITPLGGVISTIAKNIIKLFKS